MVSFNFLAAAFAAFAAVSEATYHGHMAKRHLQMRASYGNLTDIPHPPAMGTGSSALAPTTAAVTDIPHPPAMGTGSSALAPLPTTAAVTDIAEPNYTTTLTSTITKCLTVTYTLGSGQEVVTTITKYEETTKTVAHVKATLTVSPVIESTPGVPSVPASSTVAPVPSVVPGNSGSSRTSTTTLYVTAPPSGTFTVAAASTAPACPSVETVYLPKYITVYNTVTVAPPAPSAHSSGKASDESTTSRTTTRTSTTTISILQTVTLTKSRAPTGL